MKTKILLSLVAAFAALITQPVFGGTTPVIVFTELSDTTLTAVYNNGTSSTPLPVIGTTDSWSVDLSATTLSASGNANWNEPSSEPGKENQVTASDPVTFTILSDFPAVGGLPNNTISTVPIAIDGGEISVYGQFNDRGDTATVPDTGTTFGLLALALAGLFGANRVRSFRLA